MNHPYSIRIFLPGGDPDGLRTIEKSGWSSAGIVVPRALMADAKQCRELTRTGVYVLVGPPEESGLPRVYVGEGDPIKPRLEQHAANKDFWTAGIAFTSKDEQLNKAHVQYLESRLIQLAPHPKRCVLDNGNVPSQPTLSEADIADAEGFLAEMLLCFPLLGVNVFSPMAAVTKHDTRLFLSGRGAETEGAETPEGFVVVAASTAAASEVESGHGYIRELRAALIANGVLTSESGKYVFTQDYVFTSPSTAADVILGSSVNGREEWKTKDDKMLRELQESYAKK
jgi:hypothetical protein